MSKLIDELIAESKDLPTTKANDLKWYIAKPLPFYGLITIKNRIKDAIRVLNGKSFAVHYEIDK